MFIRAYLRASTNEQDASRAKTTLKTFVVPFHKKISSFYIENKSGNSLERPELMRLLDESEPGDVLLVESIDRLTRLAHDDWKTLYNTINQKGINVVSMDLPTSIMVFKTFPSDDFMRSILQAINNMLLDILAAGAYKDYRERERKQKEGIQKAKKAGQYKGRQPDTEKHQRIASFLNAKFSLNETAAAVGVSKSTVIRVKKRLEKEQL
ncbi:recombinase family protein [Endozoicomonas sp. G2_1]|uniref:recombinase family protein n=1 Tax=Endozoicomonas sp. G2_1 TaxID=2821091 RepID=UPI001ADCE351|nr:recombinase family protein [Endozoicomonas sp. G2_1]MBO9492209.1 recombinase family protein [Endozoicomonas sp. G2_1]